MYLYKQTQSCARLHILYYFTFWPVTSQPPFPDCFFPFVLSFLSSCFVIIFTIFPLFFLKSLYLIYIYYCIPPFYDTDINR